MTLEHTPKVCLKQADRVDHTPVSCVLPPTSTKWQIAESVWCGCGRLACAPPFLVTHTTRQSHPHACPLQAYRNGLDRGHLWWVATLEGSECVWFGVYFLLTQFVLYLLHVPDHTAIIRYRRLAPWPATCTPSALGLTCDAGSLYNREQRVGFRLWIAKDGRAG